MIVAIQQPEHIPWIGFFNKMAQCDLFIYLDNVQFKKRYFENRNRIMGRNGPQWLNVPVITKGRYHQNIADVEIAEEAGWQHKYLESLRHAYGKHPYGALVVDLMQPVIMAATTDLCSLNLQAIEAIRGYLEITTPVRRASELVDDHTIRGHELILDLCKKSRATTYISGPDGINYLDTPAFSASGMEICYHRFEHPVYTQKSSDQEFISHLSILDLIANLGPEAKGVVEQFELELNSHA